MSRGHRRNNIPDRWLDYQAVGKRLPGSRFIAFKVPLKLALTRRLDGPDVFGPWELLDILKSDDQELGLIIDLTFTTRYYRPEDVPESVQCVKIFTAGHEIPSDPTILSFKRAVRRFIRENADNDKVIGVHCTHGLNRTGYLICRYLIDVNGLEPDKAIELFNSSRGHSIERQNYLDDLRSGPKRSNEGIEECEEEPVQGKSTSRPVRTEVNTDNMEERPVVYTESSRYSRKRKNNHSPEYDQFFSLQLPSGLRPLPGGSGLLPPPCGAGLLPDPVPFCTYRWRPTQTNYQWQALVPRAEGSRVSRTPPPNSEWSSSSANFQRDSGSGPFPPNPAPCASGHWINNSDTYSSEAQGKWETPKMRTRKDQKPEFH